MNYRHAVFARFADLPAARDALAAVVAAKLDTVKHKLFACNSDGCADGIMAGLMNNSTWAESDARRGLTIGVVLGALLGTSLGGVLFHLLEMPESIGFLLGGIMGTLVGALMSGIVGAGLVNPQLKMILKRLETGQALLTISSRNRDDHDRVTKLLQASSIDLVTNR